ncbi:hypothetical protein PPERSA_09883 [Pseudocohnilembus persalinus]|uniref:Uncharacterized protein n=1 Tax=Pseudocohnilembus persalinus TaxID=266149 RepID=A0A0V0QTX7_PSEPJ|nr:hypothetical protein PPERSA_09883 [Pseudocohnilembus persalinus]|eukprot:KRX05743.1 hypothetical protein PPERSA_09883 [Pseudocohnilembus persalinus]
MSLFQQAYNLQKFLTRENSAYRAKQISSLINYKILFNIPANQPTFKAYQEITFDLHQDAFQNDDETKDFFFIDYASKFKPISFQINEHQLKEEDIQQNYTGIFFNLPKQLLLPGKKNTIITEIETPFVTDGNGLYSFIDTDKKQYIYSHLEPNFCHNIFPNFDQPNLKATFEISIISPKEWENIANGKQQKQIQATSQNIQEIFKPIKSSKIFEEIKENYNLTQFEKTVEFSTYIFFIGTGNFEFVELEQSKCYSGIPQRIYCRGSLKKYLLNISDQIFELMNKLFPFYENFFGFKFPWSKYDHIFCPDFNIGAMENVGAVTFNDGRIPRGQTTVRQLSQVLNVFAHELVHTWFGDLTTMDWWEDLWLKESFADSFSYYAINQLQLSFEITDQDQIFNLRKDWGVQADQKHSTHPIAGSVANTEEAKSIFDGITYAKGAATLKQLLFLLGPDAFSKAMSTYCQKYAFKNTTFQNFIDCLQEQFENPNFTLNEWKQQWLLEPGMNIIEPLFDPSNPELIIKQSAYLQKFPTLRYHKINIGFFKEDGSVDVQTEYIKPESQTSIKFDTSKNYKAVLLNYDDHDFVHVRLDKISSKFFAENLSKIKKPLDVQLIVRGFEVLVQDSVEKSQILVDLTKSNPELLEQLLEKTISSISQFSPSDVKKEQAKSLFDFFFNYLKQNIKNLPKDYLNILQTKLITLAGFFEDKQSFEILLSWYQGQQEILPKFTIDNQWAFIVLAHKQPEDILSKDQKNKLFEQQKQQDNSDNVMYKSNTCQAILEIQGDNDELRQNRWQTFINCSESKYMLQASLQGFNQGKHKQNIQKYYESYFAQDLLTVFEKNSIANSLQFAQLMFPKTDNIKWLKEKINDLLSRVPQNQLTLKRFLSDRIDDLNKQELVFNTFYTQK